MKQVSKDFIIYVPVYNMVLEYIPRTVESFGF